MRNPIEKYLDVKYTAWYCPNGEMGHFVCYMATQKDVDEHLKKCKKMNHNQKNYDKSVLSTIETHSQAIDTLSKQVLEISQLLDKLVKLERKFNSCRH